MNQPLIHFFKALLLFVCVALSGCYDGQRTMLIADSYSPEKDVTTLQLIPYGDIKIPGKWTKTSFNESSKQHFFSNSDSISIAVALNPMKKYSFYQPDVSAEEFLTAFFNWEKDFYEQNGIAVTKINREPNYVIFSVKKENINTILLFGAKEDMALNYAISSTKWDDSQRIKFLKTLFELN